MLAPPLPVGAERRRRGRFGASGGWQLPAPPQSACQQLDDVPARSGDPVEQSRQVSRDASGCWQRRDLVRRPAIDNDQAGVGGGTVLGVDGAVNRGREHDLSLFPKSLEGLDPGGIIGGDVCAHDGDQASASRKTGQRRADVP